MKISLTICFIVSCSLSVLYGQTNRVAFDDHAKLKDGVYSSIDEILSNNPKYPISVEDAKRSFWTGNLSLFYVDSMGSKQKIDHWNILMLVFEGENYIYFRKGLYKPIETGAISTFYIEHITHYGSGYSSSKSEIYFWDLLTGKMDRITPDNLEHILKRDSTIYSSYSELRKSQKKKLLYYHIREYNKQNKLYIE